MAGFAESNSGLSDPAKVIYFDGGRSDDLQLNQWLIDACVPSEIVKPRDAETRLAQLAETVKQRLDSEPSDQPPIVVVIDPLERFRDLRQEESFSFSLDAAGSAKGPESLQQVLRDGPAVGVFTIVVCGSAETLSRWLPRASRHDLQQRILGRINSNDSSALIDRPDAANLSAATMLIYDDVDGGLRKFRVCGLPPVERVRDWLRNAESDQTKEAEASSSNDLSSSV
jgi:S-DNA-T family DNA segregation ATPase FtsK/SpoIIIE